MLDAEQVVPRAADGDRQALVAVQVGQHGLVAAGLPDLRAEVSRTSAIEPEPV
jgi:hypothetical protein